jgi:PAS domain S-box-containing protein
MHLGTGSEIVFERLLDTFMRIAIEQSGARRGVLVSCHSDSILVEAEARVVGQSIEMALRGPSSEPKTLPFSILRRVQRTAQVVIVSDASNEAEYRHDPFVLDSGTRSILCLPVSNQARLTGMLYLEKDISSSPFTQAHVSVLRLVTSQAAVAIENANLYRDLATREETVRRLVDANIIGIILCDSNGRIVEANDAFLRVVGYDREDLRAGMVSWSTLTQNGMCKEGIDEEGLLHPRETEYRRKDGSWVPVMVGGTVLDSAGKEGVAFVLDLSDRKQAERTARENQQRYEKIQSELAHASRVSTLGQLAASIAHEVNQPISATIINAGAALRWLRADPPNIEEAQHVLERIIGDGKRAAAVVGRIRAQINRTPTRKESVNLADAIDEVLALTRVEASKHRIALTVELLPDAPIVAYGDRVELQQVLLNLVLNGVDAINEARSEQREITILVDKDGDDIVLIQVRDTGCGLAPGEAEQVFAPLFTTKASGLGMGLAICRTIIESHGGLLWASSDDAGRTVFSFTVPSSNGQTP